MPQKKAATPTSIADARAELPLPQMHVEQDTSVFTAPRVPATDAGAVDMTNSQRANADDANAQRSVFASRWPEASGVSSSVTTGMATSNQVAELQSNAGTAAPPPAVAAVTLAAADVSEKVSSDKASGSVTMLLIVMVGALSLAGLIASAIFRFASARSTGGRKTKVDRRAIWDTADTDGLSPSTTPNAGAHLGSGSVPREPRMADDPNARIGEMLTLLARSART